jgi:hypothetical protein
MVAPTRPDNYSAYVRLELRFGNTFLPLAQIADDRMIFSDNVVLPGHSGTILAVIGDSERRWMVRWAESKSPRQVVPIEFEV